MDFRDVLVSAEYPRYAAHVDWKDDQADPRVQRVIAADWQEYQEWFQRG